MAGRVAIRNCSMNAAVLNVAVLAAGAGAVTFHVRCRCGGSVKYDPLSCGAIALTFYALCAFTDVGRVYQVRAIFFQSKPDGSERLQ